MECKYEALRIALASGNAIEMLLTNKDSFFFNLM